MLVFFVNKLYKIIVVVKKRGGGGVPLFTINLNGILRMCWFMCVYVQKRSDSLSDNTKAMDIYFPSISKITKTMNIVFNINISVMFV